METIQESVTNNYDAKNLEEHGNRYQLLKDLPVREEKIPINGISTSVLIGGKGSEIILLHGPGENSLWWMQTIPDLVKNYKVIVPDLPGNGESKVSKGNLQIESIFAWLDNLIELTCEQPPTLVGHVLGGAIAARFAINQGKKLGGLVLVDSLGLAKFRPSLRFAFGLIRFMYSPTEKNYHLFLPHCLYNMESLQQQMGNKWDHFIAYNLECANDPDIKSATQTMMKKIGIPKIPSKDLAKINIPTALIWGKYDRANRTSIAQKVSKKYHWPLYVIEEARDDPKLEQPGEFIQILEKIYSDYG